VDYRGIIGHDSKEAIVFFDKGTEDLTLRVDYKTDGRTTPSRLAWIITVPSQPISYSVGNNELFADLYWWLKTEDPFAPPPKMSYDGVVGGYGGGGGLIVGKAVTVGPYQIQPVRAVGMNALSALNKWLKDNGFPTESASHTAYFVNNGFTFLCVKVLPPNGQARLDTSVSVHEVGAGLRRFSRQPC
jgi:hypothetical protein